MEKKNTTQLHHQMPIPFRSLPLFHQADRALEKLKLTFEACDGIFFLHEDQYVDHLSVRPLVKNLQTMREDIDAAIESLKALDAKGFTLKSYVAFLRECS